MPEHLLRLADQSGRGLVLTLGPVTDFPRLQFLRGVVPRGWNKTWESVPGVGGGTLWNQPAVANIESLTQDHGSQNLIIHEVLHNVDFARAEYPGEIKFSDEPEFRKLWTETEFIDSDWYQATYPEEAFAELGALYFDSPTSRQELRDLYPKWFDYFRSLAQIPTVSF